jgi:hypothetical protein
MNDNNIINIKIKKKPQNININNYILTSEENLNNDNFEQINDYNYKSSSRPLKEIKEEKRINKKLTLIDNMKEIINNNKKNNFIITNYNKIYTNNFTIESYNSTESNQNQQENEDKIDNELTETLENYDNIDKIYEIMHAYKMSNKLNLLLLKTFVISPVPINKCLITNVIINKHCFLKTKKILNSSNEIKPNSKFKDFDFYMELNNNNQIFLAGLICDFVNKIKIKIFITTNENNFKYIGKLESNVIRNFFIVLLGENKSNYQNIMSIKYNINLLEIFHLRKINIKIFNNNNENEININNKMPLWSNKYNLYQLAFNNNNRVKFKSNKNFIIINKDNINLIECGKKEKNKFSLDFVNPISPFMAFAICLSSLIKKISC